MFSKNHQYKFGKWSIALKRLTVCAALVGATLFTSAYAQPCKADAEGQWIGTWASTPSAPAAALPGPVNEEFENVTLRQLAHIGVGGVGVRVTLSNFGATTPLVIGAANIAKQRDGAKIWGFSNRTLKFDGSTTVTIAPGESVVSDPVLMVVAPQADLAVSVYLPEATGPTSWHQTASETGYISTTGNFSADIDFPAESTTTTSRYFLAGIDVLNQDSVSSIVFFGDSITDGYNSTVDGDARYPDLFSDVINYLGSPRRAGIINQGLSGNRLLNDGIGLNALARFDRDVLEQSGVSHVVVQIGINDIGLPTAFGIPPVVTSADIIAGLTELADRGHAAGLTMYAGTLLPFAGTIFPGYYTPEGEAVRQEVNAWLLDNEVFDGVIDFDAALRDPANPTFLLPAYASFDGLHPNDDGYQAMADAIDPALFD